MGTVNVLLCLSHSIEEYDQVRLLSGIGADVFSVGGYIDPASPHDPKRPALPAAPFHPDLKAAVDRAGGNGAAQSKLPDELLDWADVIIYHHLLERLMGQWHELRDWLKGTAGRRVIWRTVGQSNPDLEAAMGMLRRDGLEIVRYSPDEERIPYYAGADALIRFYKDPDEWQGWTGDTPAVLNITQNLKQRGAFCGYDFWERATADLPRIVAGPGSEVLDYGAGLVSEEDMKSFLRDCRVYLYTGTQPASYTLGLIEAMMTGIPVLSIGRSWMSINAWGPAVFEAADLANLSFDDPDDARRMLRQLLADRDLAARWSARIRARAVALFGYESVAPGWARFLGLADTKTRPLASASSQRGLAGVA